MALDIIGLSETFDAFVKFAEEQHEAGKEKAIARVDVGDIAKRTITPGKGDWVGIGQGRLASLKKANNITRDAFRKAVADMFGGESHIPESVLKAMKLEDYGKGKPLTARRILAVKAAIDADGTAAVLSLKPETRAVATDMGYVKSELPKLARAAKFYAQATGKSEVDAMRAVAEPRSNANRLMNYGGRFMASAENFADGLRLIDLFKAWHDDLSAVTAAIQKSGSYAQGHDYSAADTPSKLNSSTAVNQETRIGMEKFVFESLSVNQAANLKETDGEKIFGFRNNGASRFVGQGFNAAHTSTLGNIPPAKREVVFKVFDLFCRLAETADDQKIPAKDRYFLRDARGQVLGRILRHLDAVIALDAKGSLNARNVIKTCFPDMVKAGETGDWNLKAVKDFLDGIDRVLVEEHSDILESARQLLEQTGASLDEVVESIDSKKPLPFAQYVSDGQMPLEGYETVDGGRKQLAGDLYRPANYSIIGGQKDILSNGGFGFRFPGEERFVTNSTEEGKANIAKVGDKVAAMCGRVHEKQACNVMLMLTQSGIGVLRDGLVPYGIKSNEHSAVDFSLLRNAETGAVTIRYSSPKELPFAFEWTSTVDVDGKVTTTPLRFTDEATLKAEIDAVKGKAADIASRHPNTINADEAKARAETLLGAAGGDHSLLSVLKNPKVTERLLTSDKKLRPPEDIAKRVGGLKANVDELREATNGYGAMFDAGLRALAAFGGRALPKGILSDVVRLAKAADLQPLAKLGPGAGMASLHKGLLAFHRAVDEILLKAKVMTSFKGAAYGEELFQAKRLVAHILLGRMDDRTMDTIQDLVSGQNAGRLINVYGEYIHIAGGELPDDTPENVAYEVPGVSMGLAQTLTLLKEATVDAVGNNGSEAEETDVPGGDPIFDIVSQDLINEAEASIERRKQAEAGEIVAEQI